MARRPFINNDTIGELRQHQSGSILLPQGQPPFPAVIVLHGCNGVSQNTFAWARRLASWGYAALIINSFTPRHLVQVCDGSRALPGPERAKDVFAGAAYLRTRSDIDPARIAVLGYSHGGWTALNASTVKRIEQQGAPSLSGNRRSLSVLPTQNCATARQRYPDTCRRCRLLGAGLKLQSFCGKIW